MHLYIHIPFCKKACHYCDFHFSTNLTLQNEIVEAICQEIKMKSSFLGEKNLKTLYFGGGTPSLLNNQQFENIFKTLFEIYSFSEIKEITLEANPDDISLENLRKWKSLGINRLSIGVQSFDNATLLFMNRAHTALDARKSLDLAIDVFGSNISFDLIYGRNALNFDENLQHMLLQNDLEILSTYHINHVSAYILTIESKTAMHKWLKKGDLAEVSDAYIEKQFEMVTYSLKNMGFERYEVSNFAKNGAYAVHNTAYWQNKPYLGVGPSAHSFDGLNRYANLANNTAYIKSIKSKVVPSKIEVLSEKDRFNDLILCGLRTIWGVDLDNIQDKIHLNSDFNKTVKFYISKEMLVIDNNKLIITEKGRIFTDKISSDLFA